MKSKLFSTSSSILLSRLGKKVPVKVTHLCTFRCNLSCRYCGISKTPRKEMGIKQVKQAMNEFSEAGTIFWTFTGGEPLVRKDIGKLVKHARKLFPFVTMVTNGTLLKHQINKTKNLNYILVSLDGPKEVTDLNRGNGTFDKTIEGIRAARERAIDVVINAVISKTNCQNDFEGIRNLIELTKELGCKLNFNTIYVDPFTKNAEKVKKIFPTTEERTKALDIIKEAKKRSNFILVSDPCIEHLKKPKPWKSCYAGKLFCDLFPDGTVVPCLFKESQGINGLKHGFVQAFNSLPEIKNCVCNNQCYTELNYLLSLKPKTIAENILKYTSFGG
jgi:MoaA/NifB/PqqE/SkfB family radical SAM enzyme